MRSGRARAAVLACGVVGLLLAAVAPGFACAPGVELAVSPKQAPANADVVLSGHGYLGPEPVGPIEIRWHETDSDVGVVVASVPPAPFTVHTTIPANAAGLNYFSSTERRLSDGAVVLRAVIPFLVTPGSEPPAGATPGPQPVSASQPVPPPGYRMVAADGGIFAFGGAGFFGSMGGKPLQRPIVGMAATPTGRGYWLVAGDGGIFTFGDAGFFGSAAGMALHRPITGMAATTSGRGYWLVAADGGIFAFGDAGFFGAPRGAPLAPFVGISALRSSDGYLVAQTDSSLYAYVGTGYALAGGPGLVESSGGLRLARPIVGVTTQANGYWQVAADGGVFTSGLAGFYGTTAGRALSRPVVGLAGTRAGKGYWLAGADGGIFAFGDAPFLGSLGAVHLAQPVVGIAAS